MSRTRASRALPRRPVDATVNARRLLSVINGDWSPYQTTQQIIPYAAPPGCPNEPIVLTDTNFELLRHDIHVLFHAATAAERRQSP